jgi:hypothetical protein
MANNFISNDKLKAIDLKDKGTLVKASEQMSIDEWNKVVNLIKDKQDFSSYTEALVTICGLCRALFSACQ